MIDIGANLTDKSFYLDQVRLGDHQATTFSDLDWVLGRAHHAGVKGAILTGGSLEESRSAIHIARKKNQCTFPDMRFPPISSDTNPEVPELSGKGLYLRATVGCHPCRAYEAKKNPEKYMNELRHLIAMNRDVVVAVGECGLDYDRTEFCSIATQQLIFPLHFTLAREFQLPLFLHNRNTKGDFLRIMERGLPSLSVNCVVHSFTGSLQELQALLRLGCYIGINGCSLKTEENCRVAKELPWDRLLLETDCPYCEIRPTYNSFPLIRTKYNVLRRDRYLRALAQPPQGNENVSLASTIMQRRNEPCNLIQIAEAVYALSQTTPTTCFSINDQTLHHTPQGDAFPVQLGSNKDRMSFSSFQQKIRSNTLKIFRF